MSSETNIMIENADHMNKELNGQSQIINTTIDSFKSMTISIQEVNISANSINTIKDNIVEKINRFKF